MSLPSSLLSQCYTVFSKCEEFDDQEQVGCLFIAEEIQHCRRRLKQEKSPKARVRSTLDLLIKCECKHPEYRIALPFFLEQLYSAYELGDPLRDEIEELCRSVQKAIKSQRAIKTDQEKQKLYDLILGIDFVEQFKVFEKTIESQKTGAFLIHGQEDYGQEVLAKRLYKSKTQGSTRCIPIDIRNAKVVGDIEGIWSDIANRLRVPKDTEHRELAFMLLEIWQTSNIVLVLKGIEETYSNFISDFIAVFWSLILDSSKDIFEKNSRDLSNYFLVFLIDEKGHFGHNWAFEQQTDYLTILPALEKFHPEILSKWLSEVQEYFSQFEYLSSTALLDISGNGIPQFVYKKICQHCYVDWEDLLQCFS